MSAINMRDADETARLLHMEQEEAGVRDLRAFHQRIRDLVPGLGLAEAGELWAKYRGMDRMRPTHDIETGRYLTNRRP